MADDGKIRFHCPECGKSVSIAAVHAGKRGKCPGCGKALLIPHPAPALDYAALNDRSMQELQLKTSAHDSGWGLGAADWAVDQDTGVITFTGRTVVATAPAQIIATYNTQDGTWLWGWDHPSVVEHMGDHARQVYAFGQEHGIVELTTRKLACSEDDAWRLTALACHLCNAQGAYRGPAGTALVYLTFGEVTLSQAEDENPFA
jgi:hypothetical protein